MAQELGIKEWRDASERIGVELQMPFVFEVHDRTHVCAAYLPHFGGPKGTVVMGTMPPNFDTDSVLAADAESVGYYCSFINLQAYENGGDNLLKDTLRDWGYSGPDAQRPSWLSE